MPIYFGSGNKIEYASEESRRNAEGLEKRISHEARSQPGPSPAGSANDGTQSLRELFGASDEPPAPPAQASQPLKHDRVSRPHVGPPPPDGSVAGSLKHPEPESPSTGPQTVAPPEPEPDDGSLGRGWFPEAKQPEKGSVRSFH
jgi:hypothetical protein